MDSHTPGHMLTGAGINHTDPKAERKESMSQNGLLSLPPALLPLTPNSQCTLHLPRATPHSPSPAQPLLLWLKGALASWVLTFWKGTGGSIGSWQTGGLPRLWAGRAVCHQPRGLRHRRAVGYSFIQHLLSPFSPVPPLPHLQLLFLLSMERHRFTQVSLGSDPCPPL